MNPDSEIIVKISSEDAGSISLTHVLEQRVTVQDLVLQIVSVTGKDASRVSGILERGSFVKGMSRLRWKSFEAGGVTEACLQALPEPMPHRPFRLREASHIEMHGRQLEAVLETRLLQQRRWFRRMSAYEALEALLSTARIAYQTYDYEVHCDVFLWEPDDTGKAALADCWELIPDRPQRRQLKAADAERLLFRLPR
jgi:hypothetical protein